MGRIFKNVGLLTACLFGIIILASSCVREQSYESVRKEELAKGIHVDSVIYKVHLGMSYSDYYTYCFQMNQKGLFKPNITGDMVSLELARGFRFPVIFEFMPSKQGNSEKIYFYWGKLTYKNFSYYNKDCSIEKLTKEAMNYFENNYKGRKFIRIPNENILLKYKFVKIDGNRQITLDPEVSGQYLNVTFKDLNYIK
jgi:hypothetical protein